MFIFAMLQPSKLRVYPMMSQDLHVMRWNCNGTVGEGGDSLRNLCDIIMNFRIRIGIYNRDDKNLRSDLLFDGRRMPGSVAAGRATAGDQ